MAGNKITVTGSNRQALAQNLAAKLAEYRAVIQKDVSVSDGHIYYSHPVRKWILVRAKGNKAFITFHQDCPCDTL